jgi:hypothetical protein
VQSPVRASLPARGREEHDFPSTRDR